MTMDGKQLLLVRAHTGSDTDHIGVLRGWAVLRRGVTSSRWICTTCSKNRTNCAHVHGAPDADDADVTADVLAHERRAAKWLDPATGDRRLTSLSTQTIPSDLTTHTFAHGASVSAAKVGLLARWHSCSAWLAGRTAGAARCNGAPSRVQAWELASCCSRRFASRI